MLGLEDYLFLKFTGYGQKEEGIDKFKIISKSQDNASRDLWILFLPKTSYDKPLMFKKFVPKSSSYIAYRIPKDIISQDPSATKVILSAILRDSLKMCKAAVSKGRKINVLGLSLGGVLASRLAAEMKVEKLVMIAPGFDLSWCVEYGMLTKNIFYSSIKNGFSRDDYEKNLSSFSPKNNFGKISPKTRIELRVGVWDRVVPYSDVLKLIRLSKELKLDVHIHRKILFGHSFTCLFSGYDVPD